jgi:hypothetical protein
MVPSDEVGYIQMLVSSTLNVEEDGGLFQCVAMLDLDHDEKDSRSRTDRADCFKYGRIW